MYKFFKRWRFASGLLLCMGLCSPGYTMEMAIPAAQLPEQGLERSLRLAGENREALESAIEHFPEKSLGRKLLTETLTHLLPGDLATVSSDLLIEHIEYTLKTLETAPWRRSLTEELLRDWVVPFRIAAEPLEEWREPFYEELSPIAFEHQTTAGAEAELYKWLHKGNGNGRPFVRFVVTESRDQSPRILLEETGNGGCFEINLLYTAMLRSVGIPTRLCGVSWWSNTDQWHYWVEFWNSEERRWQRRDASYFTERDSFMAERFPFAAAYAFPPHPERRDQIGSCYWEESIPISEGYTETGELKVSSGHSRSAGQELWANVYVWNCGAWRPAAGRPLSEFNVTDFHLASTRNTYPYLVSVGTGETVAMGVSDLTTAGGEVAVQDLREGESIIIKLPADTRAR